MTIAQLTQLEKEALDSSFNTVEYVHEQLNKREAIDSQGINRPVYTINGREIAFRNRLETPTYDDSDVIVLGGPQVYPIKIEVRNDATGEYEPADEQAIKEYVDKHQNTDASRLMVTNTPEGMLSAAAVLVESEEESQRLLELEASFASRKEWSEAHRDVLDTILAAISVDDEGEISSGLDVEGWPVALAVLSGDETAKAAIAKKRAVLIETEQQRASNPNKLDHMLGRMQEAGQEIEPIPLEQLAFVHSTKHDIQRNSDGDVVLRSAGQLRQDRLPRATLHGTLNSQVGDVYSSGEKQEWNSENKIIVANLKEIIDKNKKLPNRMDGVDTEFTLNPGEELVLPNALVIERVASTDSGAIIEEHESGVRYVFKDEYSDSEKTQLRELGEQYRVLDDPKELALRIAMSRVGAPVSLMDSPSDSGHGMRSSDIAERIYMTAATYGLAMGIHFGTPEERMESDIFRNMSDMVGKFSRSTDELDGLGTYSTSAIEARRQALASGFYPARHHTLTRQPPTASGV